MTDDDLDRVGEINTANVPEVGPADRAHLAHLFTESSISLVEEINGLIVGFCIVFAPGAAYESVNYRWFMEHRPASMYLDRVAFDAAFVGRGLGSSMYTEVDRLIRADAPAATGLSLEVNVDPPNEPSLAFHHKLGFVEVGRQMSKGIEVSLMERPI
jgi:predicted GNAT superfamily acetyltransferase